MIFFFGYNILIIVSKNYKLNNYQKYLKILYFIMFYYTP